MKICSLGPELFHANRQTDMTKLIVAFRSFANATKKPEPTFLFLLFVVCLLLFLDSKRNLSSCCASLTTLYQLWKTQVRS
jgi:hypothetical protein